MYLDPGLGGMLIQVVVGIIAVAGIFIAGFRQKIVSFFKRGNQSGGHNDDIGETDEDAFMTIEEDAPAGNGNSSEETIEK